jgi:hypothetical protein
MSLRSTHILLLLLQTNEQDTCNDGELGVVCLRIGTRAEGEPSRSSPRLEVALSCFGRGSPANEGSAICDDLSELGACMHGTNQRSDVCMVEC